jgi:hypothetical protein
MLSVTVELQTLTRATPVDILFAEMPATSALLVATQVSTFNSTATLKERAAKPVPLF